MLRGGSAIAVLCLAMLTLGAAVAQAAPVNDDFADATPIALGEQLEGTNLEATGEPGEPEYQIGCESGAESPFCGPTVWYSFEAPATDTYTIETCDEGTDLDTVMGVYTGTSVNALTTVEQDDDACAGGWRENGSRVTFSGTAGTTYHVAIGGYSSSRGSFYVRAYQGSAQPLPAPDTGIEKSASFFSEATVQGDTTGVSSGPRHSATFPLTSSSPAVNFECSLDGAVFSPCSTPVSYDDLAPGSPHVFEARAVEAGVPDPTPAIERFTIDTTPPQTTVLEEPPAMLASSLAKWRLAYDPSQDTAYSFYCGLDAESPGRTCSGATSFNQLCKGPHSFHAAAFDAAANLDPTPAESRFEVTTGTSCEPPSLKEFTPYQTKATSTKLEFKYDDAGAGGAMTIEYGQTAAYGRTIEEHVEPLLGDALESVTLDYLTPGTTYHYRVSLQTPFGRATSGDQTVTTPALGGEALPAIQNQAPVVSGEHAVTVPFEIDPGGVPTVASVWMRAGGPVEPTYPNPNFEDHAQFVGTGPVAGSVQVVDLDPGVTYHYRVAAHQEGAPENEILGPEETFTTPKRATISTTFKPHFVLSRGNLAVGRLGRGVRGLIFHLHGVPAGSALFARLSLGRLKATVHGKANSSGGARVIIKLSRRFAAADTRTTKRKLPLFVTVRPPDDTASSVTVGVGLKPVPRKKHPTRR